MSADFVLHTAESGWLLTDGLGESVTLALSHVALAARHWPGGRPTAIAVERAIDEVEEAIERSGLRHADRDLLTLNGLWPADLWPRLPPGSLLQRDDVEQAFSLMVSGLESSMASSGSSRLAGEGAAALLMLRELMHHLGFRRVQLPG